MTTDDLIRDGSDYERATGDHPIIPATPPQVQVWERAHRGGMQYYVADDETALTIGAYKDDDEELPDGTVPDDVTPEQLIVLGFTPCTEPEVVKAVTTMFHTFTGQSEGGAS